MASGKEQRKRTKRAKLRAPNLDNFYNRQIRSIEPGVFTFRIVLIRPEKSNRRERFISLDRNSTDLEWSDAEGSMLSGTLTARRPGPKRVAALPIQRGHRVRLMLYWGGRWRRMWDLRVGEVPPVDVKLGQLTVELQDDLTALHLNERKWDFKKDKQHPKGWTADEITRYVCSKLGVKIGRLAKGRRKIKKLKLDGSGLEVIRKAWALEKEKTAQRFVIKLREGKLDCLPFRRPGMVFIIRAIEKEAETSAEAKDRRPTTVIKAKGRIKSGHHSKKVEETIRSDAAVAKFGRTEKEKDYGRVDSRAELREKAKQDLAASIKVERTANLSLPGVPWLEKGSCIKWITNEPGWSGKVGDTARDRAFAFVGGTSHSLTSTSYDTEITINQDDPYFEDRKRRDEARRDKKKKERKGRKPKQKVAA